MDSLPLVRGVKAGGGDYRRVDYRSLRNARTLSRIEFASQDHSHEHKHTHIIESASESSISPPV